MFKRAAGVVAAIGLVLLATGCEPSMTITAHAPGQQTCETTMAVVGIVNPATATPKVVLQHTVSGKWVDVNGWGSESDLEMSKPSTVRTGAVNHTTGAYQVNNYYAPDRGIGDFTMHLRVRSNGGGSTSPSFYVSARQGEGFC